MDELEAIKRKKLEELKSQQQEQLHEQAQLQQQIEALERVVKQKLTKEALQRYGNLKTAHPEKAMQLLAVIGQLLQTHRIDQITDGQLREILIQIQPEKKEFRIKRK